MNARNQLEAVVHTVKKSLKDYGDKLDAAEGALKSEDKSEIESRQQALAQAAQKLGEKMYAQEQAKQQAQQQAEPGAGASSGAKPDEGNVVDAEFTEVKDKKAG